MAVIDELKKKQKDIELLYIGSKNGLEKKMVQKVGVEYKGVATGKLRRYFSWQNFVDAFKIPVGILQARRILKKFRPEVVFSKGGFVSFPVVVAAKFLKIPVIIHESDMSPGLANRWSFKFAEKICMSFGETKKFLTDEQAKKSVLTGTPVRKEIMKGDANAGRKFTGMDHHRPIILVMGGSQGAQQINKLVRDNLPKLLKKFQVVHIAGRGNIDISIKKKGYKQYEFLNEQLRDVYAASELIISRAGANSLAEIAILRKKAVLIPLSTGASRGDQLENAKIYGQKYGWSVLYGNVSDEDFVRSVQMTFKNRRPDETMENGTDKIVDLILKK